MNATTLAIEVTALLLGFALGWIVNGIRWNSGLKEIVRDFKKEIDTKQQKIADLRIEAEYWKGEVENRPTRQKKLRTMFGSVESD